MELYMTLYDEVYFEITLTGTKASVKKFVAFLEDGGLDDFFEYDPDFIDYSDNYDASDDDARVSVSLANDEYGIEVEELDTDDFLDVLCRAARALEVRGELYDADEDEYRFISAEGDSYYVNAKNMVFNDELDEKAAEEDDEED